LGLNLNYIFLFILFSSLLFSQNNRLTDYYEYDEVTNYYNLKKDTDNDGVFDTHDKCPKTPKGIIVNKKGCEVKTLFMLMENEKDHNAIVITTKAGSVVIGTAGEFVYVDSVDDMPSEPIKMSVVSVEATVDEVILKKVPKESKRLKFLAYFNLQEREFVEQDKILEFIESIRDRKDMHIKIIGHTDSAGTKSLNEEIARERAASIYNIFINSDLVYKSLKMDSYGESNLIVKTKDGVREALNRRVEILIR